MKRILTGMTAMAIGNFGGGTFSAARRLGGAVLVLALVGWSGQTGAVQMQTGGSFSVGPDGSADFTLAIDVPPGTAGVAPSLSLNYSSHDGDGIVGVGWSLSGLPAITRCPQTIAQDGQVAGVNFTVTDRFCFGGQRLVMTSNSAYYGADGATFRTEIDGFSNIVSHEGSQTSGPQFFTVQTKSGQTLEFGNPNVSANSFVQAAGLGFTAARAWALDKVTDHFGNFYTVTYAAENTTTGETHPTEIQYTGNNGSSLTPYNSVQFIYGPAPGASGATSANSRAHPLVAHLAGTTATTSVLLTHIETFNQNSSGSAAMVSDYQLSYATGSSGRPQLAKIEHCDGGSPQSCLPPTTFAASNATLNTATTTILSCSDESGVAGFSGAQPYVVDLNNDGRDDILWSSLWGTNPPNSVESIVNPLTPEGSYAIWYSNGDGTFTCGTSPSFNSEFKIQFVSVDSEGDKAEESLFGGFPLFGDFAGTGRTDILLEGAVSSQPEFELEVNSNDQGTFTDFPNPISTAWLRPAGFVATQVAVGDFEGRGRSSIIAYENQASENVVGWGFYTNSVSNPTSYTFTQSPPSSNGLGSLGSSAGLPPVDYAAYAVDVNGDGKADIIFDSVNQTTGLSTGTDRELAISNGTTFTLQKLNLPVSVGAAAITVGDFNGDGIADLIFNPLSGSTTTGQIIVLLGKGDGTFTQVSAGQPAIFSSGALAGYQLLAGNFSGTGLTDLLVEQQVNAGSGASTGIFLVLTANGDGTFTAQGSLPLSAASFAANSRPLIGDFAGVGHDSILWDGLTNPTGTNPVDPASNGTDTLLLASSTQPDLVTAFASGLAGTNFTGLTAVTYTPISGTNATIYSKTGLGTVSYPTVSLQTALPVVTEVETSDGIGGARTFNYSYSSLRADLTGRGSLGFGFFGSTDNQTGITTITGFSQSFPEIGLPDTIETLISNSSAVAFNATLCGTPSTGTVILSCTGFTYDAVAERASTSTSPGVTFVGQTSTEVQRNDLNGTALPTANTSTAYDCTTQGAGAFCFGNVTSQTVAPNTGLQTQTTLAYEAADTTNWLISEVGMLSVEDTVPNEASVTRTANFTYASGTGALASSVIESGQTFTNVGGQNEDLQLTTTFSYDAYGNPTVSDVTPAESSLSARDTTASWATPSSNLNSGSQFNQFLQSVTDALGHTAHLGYDTRFGSVIAAADVNNNMSTSDYDTFGRPLLTFSPDGTGSSTTYAYCSILSNPGVGQNAGASCPTNGAYTITATAVDASFNVIGPKVVSTYDVLGRVIQTDTVAFDGSSTSRVTTSYNTLGEVTQVTQPFLTSSSGTPPSTQFQYDTLARATQITNPDGGVITKAYSGLVETDTLPGSLTSTTTRNALGQTVSVVDALGNTTSYAYFAFGNLASVTDPAGNVVSYSYDTLGRQTGVVDPDSGTRSATYFSTGDLATATEPGGSSGAAAVTVTYAYDVLGRVTSRTEPDLHSTWTYDPSGALGLLASASTASGDAAGFPGGCIYTYGYDSLSRPSTTTLQFGSAAPITFTDAYVPAPSGSSSAARAGEGQLASVTNGASGAVTNFGYTALGYFQQLSRSGSGVSTAAPVYTIASADASLRPLSTTLGTAAFTNSLAQGTTATVDDTYSYDSLFELTGASNLATSKTFAYDTKTGNLTSKSDTGTYAYGSAGGAGPHRLQSITAISGAAEPVTASYTYDPRGNMLTGEDGGSYAWTSFNQPQTIAKDGAGVQYYYDMNHNRIGVATTTGGSTVTKLYLHDASGAFAEATQTSSGALSTVLDYFSAGSTPVGMLTTPFTNGSAGTPSMSYFHSDASASITAISNDSGAVTEFDSFDPWGKRRNTDGADDPGNVNSSTAAYGYIDEEQIAGVSDLVNLNARIYDRHTGRFISPDPIGLGGGRNVYAYSGNNPTSASDRSGLAVACGGSIANGAQFCTDIPDPPAPTTGSGIQNTSPAVQPQSQPSPLPETIAPTPQPSGGAGGDTKSGGSGQDTSGTGQGGNPGQSSSTNNLSLASGIPSAFTGSEESFTATSFSGDVGAGVHNLTQVFANFIHRFQLNVPGQAYSNQQTAVQWGSGATNPAANGCLGCSTFNGLVTTLVPGAQFAQQAQADFRDGNVGLGAVAVIGSLADAALGAVTLGESTELQAGIRTAASVSRNAAFRLAKELGGIPRSVQPISVFTERLRDQIGNQLSRVFQFLREDGFEVTIREHSLGHVEGDIGPHFNVEVRPPGGGPRQPLVGGADDHVFFDPN